MTNDFDLLLKKCKVRAFKRILRITLRIFASIALAVAGVLGYLYYTASQIPTAVTPLPQKILPAPAASENNSTLSAATAVIAVKPAIGVKPVAGSVPVALAPVKIVPVAVAAIQQPVPNNRILEVTNESAHPSTPAEIYQRAPKFETALTIARDFYGKEDYIQAAIWAKKANQINREAEEAWLLYAKSYYAQGKKNEAIGVLELYLNYKESKAAAELIKTWR